MGNLKKLSVKELENLRSAAKAELQGRKAQTKKIARLRDQVERRLANAGLSISDLYPSLDAGTSRTRASSKPGVKGKKKSVVKPKYKDRTGKNKWTGRGRSPAWVRDICEKEGIDVMEFKARAKYRI